MSGKSDSNEFELVFEGPGDASEETLRRLKGAFVGSLEFDVQEVQRFLESAPLTILKAATKEELTVSFETLQAAGGKVFIIEPKPKKQEGVEAMGDELWIEEPEGGQKDNLVESPEEVESIPLDFELGEEPVEVGKKEAAPVEEETTEEQESSGDLSFDLGVAEETVEEVQEPQSSEEPEEVEVDDSGLSFDLSAAEEPQVEEELVEPTEEEQSFEESSGLGLDAADDEPETVEEQQPRQEISTLETTEEIEQEEEAAPGTPSKEELDEDFNEEHPIHEDDVYVIAGEAAPPSGKKNKKANSNLGRDLAIGGVIALFLVVGNWFFFGMSSDEKDPAVETSQLLIQMQQNIAKTKQAKKKKQEKAKKKAIKEAQVAVSGASTSAPFAIEWQLVGNTIESVDLSATLINNNRDEATPEQIVRGEILPPWVSKIDIADAKMKWEEEGFFNGVAIARLYIDYRGQRKRMVADFAVSGRYDAANKKLVFKLSSNQGFEGKEIKEPLYIEVLEGDKFLVAANAVVSDPEMSAEEIDLFMDREIVADYEYEAEEEGLFQSSSQEGLE